MTDDRIWSEVRQAQWRRYIGTLFRIHPVTYTIACASGIGMMAFLIGIHLIGILQLTENRLAWTCLMVVDVFTLCGYALLGIVAFFIGRARDKRLSRHFQIMDGIRARKQHQ